MITAKQFKPTSVMIEMANTVFKAMAWEQTIKPIVEGYQKKILADMQPKPAMKLSRGAPDIILNPDHTYMMKDEDFKLYLKRCNEEQDKAGLVTEKPEYCPLLVAHDLVTKAERALIETMEPLMGISPDDLLCAGLDKYEKYIDLTLRLLAPFVKN